MTSIDGGSGGTVVEVVVEVVTERPWQAQNLRPVRPVQPQQPIRAHQARGRRQEQGTLPVADDSNYRRNGTR